MNRFFLVSVFLVMRVVQANRMLGLGLPALRRQRTSVRLATCATVMAMALAATSTTWADTVDTFDVAGTPRTDSQFNIDSPPGPTVIGGGWDAGGPNVMQLVNAVNGQDNQIAYDLSDAGMFPMISTQFEYRMTEGGAIGGGGRADGLGVVLLNTADHGTSGGIDRFTAEEPDVAGSIGVGFDIYNSGASDNNNNNHVSLHYPGFPTAIVDVTSLGIDLADGVNHGVQINVAALSGLTAVNVLIDGTDVFGGALSIPGATAYESRLLMAGRTGGENARVELDNIDVSYSNIVPIFSLTVDRDTGALSLLNNTPLPIDMAVLSILSDAGALAPATWTSITGHYDTTPPDGDGSVSSDEWLFLASTASELSEATLGTGTISPGQTVDLGAAWGRYIEDASDIRAEYLDANSGELVKIVVQVAGNNGNPFEVGDLNFDDAIDAADWGLFRAGLGGDYSASTIAQAYRMGDLDGDLDSDLVDFQTFEGIFNAANGSGALADLMGVPEPSTWVLLMMGGLALLAIRRRRSHARLALFVVVVAMALAMGSTAFADTVDTFDVAGTPRTDLQVGSAPGPAVIGGSWDAGGPNVMQLVDAVASQNNQIAYDLSDPGVFPMIDTHFEYRMTEVGSRADGIGVVLLNTADHGTSGGIVGFAAEEPDLAGSIGIGFDIYNNGTIDNNNNNHISVHYPGFTTTLVDVTGLGLNLADGVNHTVQINVAAQIGVTNVTVWIDSIDVFGGAVSIPGATAYESRLLIAGRTGGANARVELDNINVQWSDPPTLSLLVNTVTGGTSLVNNTGEALSINGYQITSAAGSLNAVGWNSLEEQDLPNFPAGNGTGNGWEEGESVNPNSLVEVYLQGNSTLAIGASLPIGNPFNTGIAAEDLVFQYSIAGGPILAGGVEYTVELEGADFDGDLDVDGADFLTWQRGFGMASPSYGDGDANTDGNVDGTDLGIWKVQFGTGGAAAGLASAAVPEPSTLGLLSLALFGLAIGFIRRNPGGQTMHVRKMSLLFAVIALLAFAPVALADSTLDRQYQMGEEEGGAAGTDVFQTYDSYVTDPGFGDQQNLEIGIYVAPTYVNLSTVGTGRTGLGIQFAGEDEFGDGGFLTGDRLGVPYNSAASDGYLGGTVGPLDYSDIADRGIQGWVYPSDPNAGAQDIIMDGITHGVQISATGTWQMRYWSPPGNSVYPDSDDFDTGIAVTTDWHHVQVVRAPRPGDPNRGSTFYLDGVAVAFAPGGYWGGDNNNYPLVLGANSGDTDSSVDEIADPGTEHFFVGVLDDVELFINGTTSGDPAIDYGDFNAGTDNPIIAEEWRSVADGDIDQDGNVNDTDVGIFISNWRAENTVMGYAVGDGTSRGMGDFNFDGIIDVFDWFIIRDEYAAAGGGSLNLGELLAAVPEPSSVMLLLLGTAALGWMRRR